MESKISKERLAGALVFVLAIAAIVSVAVGTSLQMMGVSFPGRTVLTLRPGTPAPPFELASLQGEKVSLEQFKGRPVLIMFWGAS
ncbi:MAG: redoxin domain-containing protein [Candidatus Hydrogenedentota bacterium]|nr:MAG: redoxin domain-containing protein [Candidatus Hydrogenedentota bacterium]